MEAASQQRIVTEVDARHHMRGTEGDLLGLGEEIVGVAVEHHATDRRYRYQFFGDQLGRVEHVEAEAFGLVLGEDLKAELPFRVITGFDGVPQIATMKVGIGAGDLDRLVPDQRMGAQFRRPVELDEVRLASRIDQPEGVHAESLHHPVAARDTSVGHDPHQHVRALGHQRDEVPKSVMRRSGLRHGVMWFGFDGVDQIRKLHRVLDEEDRDVVADQIPVAFVGVELDGEAARVARRIDRAALASNGREAHEDRRDLARLLEGSRAGEFSQRLVGFEITVRGRPACMNDALGNAFVVEVGDLLAQDEVFKQRRPAQTGFQRILVVADGNALVGRQHLASAIGARAVE